VNRFQKGIADTTITREDASHSLTLLNHELIKHHELYPKRSVAFQEIKLASFSDSTYSYATSYLAEIKDFYKVIYNRADELQDQKRSEWSSTPQKRQLLIDLKNEYYNTDLERFMRNSNNFFSNKIIEYKGALWQKMDPIFQDSHHPFLKAHFFAPTKKIGSWEIETYWANLMIIWLINTILFVTLYLKGLNSLFNIGKQLKKVLAKHK